MKSLHKLPLLALALAACWLSPASAQDSIDSLKPDRIIWLHPNGVDDTSALQGALDSCSGIRCVIRLTAGVFHTAPLVANNFHGVMRGAGQHDTIVRTLTDRVLHVSDANPFNSVDPTPEDPWPSLIVFIEGDVRLSHMTFDVPEETITDGWWPVCSGFDEPIPVLADAVSTSGRFPMKLAVRHVSIAGAPTADPVWPRSLINGVTVAGGLLPPDFADPCADMLPIKAEVVMDGNHFASMFAGSFITIAEDASIVIKGNVYRDMLLDGIEFFDVRNSKVYIAYNDIEVLFGAGILLFQNSLVGFGLPLFDGSDFVAMNNSVRVLDGSFAAIQYSDFVEGAAPNTLDVVGNYVEATESTVVGILASQIDDVQISKNSVVGESIFGAGIELSNGCRMNLNDFSGLTPQEADIILTNTTSNCRVTAFNGDTVLDLGTDNKVTFR